MSTAPIPPVRGRVEWRLGVRNGRVELVLTDLANKREIATILAPAETLHMAGALLRATQAALGGDPIGEATRHGDSEDDDTNRTH